MNADQIAKANAELRSKPALEIVKWAIAQANGRAIVSTNYRPYEAVILHLATQVQPDIPVLWVDHGYNRAATYKHAEEVKKLPTGKRPFKERPVDEAVSVWVEPTLWAEVQYASVTPNGTLREPVFLRLRPDLP